MRFYTRQHRYYCGIDLHARTMYVVVMDQTGQVLVERNMKTNAAEWLKLIEPYRSDIVVAVECIFTWYWLADRIAFLDLAVGAEDDDADVIGLEVERHAAEAAREFDHLAGLDVVEAVEAGDAVADLDDAARLLEV